MKGGYGAVCHISWSKFDLLGLAEDQGLVKRRTSTPGSNGGSEGIWCNWWCPKWTQKRKI